MYTQIKIESIKTDTDGCKLIAFSHVLNFPKCKPQTSPVILADYKGNKLRIFNGNTFIEKMLPSWKSALLYIRGCNINL